MTVAEYIVDRLIQYQVTDAFGIPGGVVLDFLYAMDARKGKLCPHLSYHEQSAGFAACGYAQASGKLGVAYATRGPGFTNLITPIADAFYDSLPTLFITAHAAECPPDGMRVMADQEMDTIAMVGGITKLAIRMDSVETFAKNFDYALKVATTGRKGPVFMDISTSLWRKEVVLPIENYVSEEQYDEFDANLVVEAINNAKRPIVLVGDGVNLAGMRNEFIKLITKWNIPVISSRCTHDLLPTYELYIGYVGSHGMRSANFALSKADLILAIGNRMHFPVQSKSFADTLSNAKIIRLDVDASEFKRKICNTTNIHCDIRDAICKLSNSTPVHISKDWRNVCNTLKKELAAYDVNSVVNLIAGELKDIPHNMYIVSDVGNCEFWLSRACAYNSQTNRTLYSKSFGALGCGLGKAIGVYYATKAPVICVVGDQGLQMNSQELQYIGQHQLPIKILVINNLASGMIRDREVAKFGYSVHTTHDSGYCTPNLRKVAEVYGLNYNNSDLPTLNELVIENDVSLIPYLPLGNTCQDMVPAINKSKYEFLESL